MTTAAPLYSPVSPIQIPCKLVLDYAFEEDSFPLCANIIQSLPSPATPSSCTRAVGKRERTNGFAQVCSSPRKRFASSVKNVDRRVRFRTDSKQFDGLQPLSEALELTVWNFYTVQNIQSAEDILSLFKSRSCYLAVFEQVGSAINHLVELLEKNTCVDTTVPVLPRGGGRGVLLGRKHLQSFKQLRDMFMAAIRSS